MSIKGASVQLDEGCVCSFAMMHRRPIRLDSYPKDRAIQSDWLSPIACLILAITGILFIYSAQSTISDSD